MYIYDYVGWTKSSHVISAAWRPYQALLQAPALAGGCCMGGENCGWRCGLLQL